MLISMFLSILSLRYFIITIILIYLFLSPLYYFSRSRCHGFALRANFCTPSLSLSLCLIFFFSLVISPFIVAISFFIDLTKSVTSSFSLIRC